MVKTSISLSKKSAGIKENIITNYTKLSSGYNDNEVHD
jgi:hypothetical protein